mgnify:CR=1 FL=1
MKPQAKANQSPPCFPKPDATQQELYECMGELLAWSLNQRLGQLLAAGFKADELMKLRNLSVRFQSGNSTIGDLNAIRRMLPKLEKVRIM